MKKKNVGARRPKSQAVALPGTVTPTSLQLPGNLPYADWENGCRLAGTIHHASPWWMVDLLLYGERHFGEKFAQGSELLRLSPKTRANLMWVGEHFPPERRRAAVSIEHHAAVAALEPAEQEAWLARAEQEGWTRRQLRKALKGVQEPDDAPEPCQLHHCKDCEATWEQQQ